ncbi:SDR family oxidoreductase [Arthrobacter sp. AZCC_0090]|uniref:SDR family oxidoreductase n=1 Tax=Arthrobacter sp. AZCC_0090 TaxID=2735881 RepID=UPI001611B91C|nr:SDR family oxidoreductase [Arthrobacter sp. AZCC_0090]MBB6405260.1 NAD(P)-dependent dehydrogenase (short-subunit alcohol dehydrogenase family) [Arthrobacter sp. AZCC_0090]
MEAIEGKVAVLTAAGSGIGAGIARELAVNGYRVAILSSTEKGKSLAEELGGFGVVGSNRDPVQLERLVEETVDRYGRVDALVNSAGHGPKGSILELSDDDWLTGLETYFLNVVRMCRLVTPHFSERGGAVVNISTSSPFEPNPGYPTSAAFRASLAVFTKLYADEYGPQGVRINNILPGFIDTFPVAPEKLTQVPLRRAGTVEDVSKLALYLLSDEAGYVTGQNWRIDGGMARSV